MKSPRPLFAILVIGILATTASAWATVSDDELERERLARIAAEIEQVQVMVGQAEQSSPTGQRVKFRYDWLQRDLEMLRQGITTHIDAPRQPRPVAPLRGDYRQCPGSEAMYGDMKAGFMDASGVDPVRMKVFAITLVFGVILVIAAWFGKMILEAYTDGEIEQDEAIESAITVIVIVCAIFVFVAWL